MFTFIAVSFHTKGQSVEDIKYILEDIYAEITKVAPQDKIVLVHSFLPRHLAIAKGIPTDAIDALDDIFPVQLSCYLSQDEARKNMAEILAELGGEAHIIGEVSHGVAEEVALYDAASVKVVFHPLP